MPRTIETRPRDRCCNYDHPRRERRVTEFRFEDTLLKLCTAGGLRGFVEYNFLESLDRTHRRNPRRYAQVDPRYLEFQFTRAILWLPEPNLRAVLMHEIGHCLDPDGTEDEADAAANAAFGVTIRYDNRWPGKGLQTLADV